MFYPVDYLAPATGQSVIEMYRALYSEADVNFTSAAALSTVVSIGSTTFVPSQSLVGPSSLQLSSITLSNLPMSPVGTAPLLTVAVQGRNIAGWGSVGTSQVALVGVPAAPVISAVQLSTYGASATRAQLNVTISMQGQAPAALVVYSYGLLAAGTTTSTSTVIASILANQSIAPASYSVLLDVPVASGGSLYALSVNASNVAGTSAVYSSVVPVASCAAASLNFTVVQLTNQSIGLTFPLSASAGGGAATVTSYTVSWQLLLAGSATNAALLSQGAGNATLVLGSANVNISQGSVQTIIVDPSLLTPLPGPGFFFNFSVYATNTLGACPQNPAFVVWSVVNFQLDPCCFVTSNPTYSVFAQPTAAQISAAGSHNIPLTSPANSIVMYNGASLASLAFPTCSVTPAVAAGFSSSAGQTNGFQYFNTSSQRWASTYTGSDHAVHPIDDFILEANGNVAGAANPYQQLTLALDTPLESWAGAGGSALFSAIANAPLRLNMQCNVAGGAADPKPAYCPTCVYSCLAFSVGTLPSFNVSYTVAESATCAAKVATALGRQPSCSWPYWRCAL